MLLVVIESPWAGMKNWPRAIAYLKSCIRDSVGRGELPIASHAMFAHTDALNEHDIEQRTLGINLQKAYIERADLVAVYVDYGFSTGMRAGIHHALYRSIPLEQRKIGEVVC